MRRLALILLGGMLVTSCARGDGDAATAPRVTTLPVRIMANGRTQVFRAELARTKDEQAQGLMYRTNLAPDFAMLFAPYPAEGGGPREASFWMKNTPSPLDIIYIRADGTIARIAENAVPFSETPITSGEPVAAVLEVRGGRTAELGIGEGDMVRWTMPKAADPAP